MARREWSLRDARARFSAVVEAARREPQMVTKRGRPAVVVMSIGEFEALRKRTPTPEKRAFADHLLAMPRDDGAFPRMHLRPRKIRF